MTSWHHISPPWDQRLARPIARLLARTPVTPNQVTTVSLLLGVAGAVFFASGGTGAYWGALLYVMAQFVDHMDGELARMTGQTSVFGHHYDHIAGGIFEFGLFCGVGIGLGSNALGGWAMTLGFIAAISVAVTVAVRLEISRRHGNDAIDQPNWFGFEIEDIMYLVAPIAWLDGLDIFLLLASIGIPVFMLLTVWEFYSRGRLLRRQADEKA
ncbi:MAG: CDP-alcohol phosphatidyltransferase family protein [Alphaproteobacteria bacterium]|nr:CDP-alcohol phosphatidyltransferase family protein [Alphaproteobacteria bacterium]